MSFVLFGEYCLLIQRFGLFGDESILASNDSRQEVCIGLAVIDFGRRGICEGYFHDLFQGSEPKRQKNTLLVSVD